MTAAIVVNDRLMQPASKNHAAVWQPRSADELRNLTALAQAAVGFDATRGDVLTVQDLAFDDNRPQPPVAIPQQLLSTAENLAGAGQVPGAAFGLAGGGGVRRAAGASPRRNCAGGTWECEGKQGTAGRNRSPRYRARWALPRRPKSIPSGCGPRRSSSR